MTFFTENYPTAEPMFGTVHLIFLGCFIAVTIGLYFMRGLFASNKVHRIFVLIVAGVLFALETYVKIFSVVIKGTSGVSLLPLHLCSFLIIVLLIAMVFGLRRLMEIIFFWSMLGPVLALIVINTEYGFPHFKVVAYMMTHFILFIMPLYYMWTKRISRFGYKDMLRSFFILMLVAIPVAIINLVFGKNFMYLLSAPPGLGVLDSLGVFYTPLFILAMFAFFNLIYVIVNIPTFIRNHKKKSQELIDIA